MSLILPVQTPKYNLEDYGLHPKLPEVPDSSMLNDWLNCNSMFYLMHVLGLRHKGPVPVHFEWGTRWHSVLYQYYEDYCVDDALDVLATNWPRGLDDTDPKGRTLDRMVVGFTRYIHEVALPERDTWGIIRREQYFDVQCEADNESCPYPWKGCNFRYCGRWDRVDEHARNHRGYIRDYKTSSYMAGDFFDKLRWGIQMPGYAWAASHLLPGLQVDRCYVDVLHTIKTKQANVHRELQFTVQQIEEWLNNVRRLWTKILWMYDNFSHNMDAWDKDWNECRRLWPCNFVGVHHTPDIRDTRLRILSEDFVEDRWDPADAVS